MSALNVATRTSPPDVPFEAPRGADSGVLRLRCVCTAAATELDTTAGASAITG